MKRIRNFFRSAAQCLLYLLISALASAFWTWIIRLILPDMPLWASGIVFLLVFLLAFGAMACRRILALLLCALTLFACLSPGFAAEADSGTDPPTEQVETPTKPATEGLTEAVAEVPTDVPTEAETEAPATKQTEAPTEQPTGALTEPPTEAPTASETGPVTEPCTEVPAKAGEPPEGTSGAMERTILRAAPLKASALSPWTFHNFGWGETWYIYCPQGSMYSKFSAERDGGTKVAYCLNRDLSSPGPSVKYQSGSYPTTKHYKVAAIVCALGYPSNSVARIKEMWGYDLTAIQAQQATQVAIGAAQKALKEGWTVDKTYDSYVGSRSGYQSVYDYSKKLCARALELVNSSSTAAKYTIAVDVTNALTTSKLAVNITPYRAYGQYKIVIKNLPSGTLLTTGQNTRVVESDGTLSTVKNKAVSGNITIRGLGGASGESVGKFTLSSIPKGSSNRSISVTATSFAKVAPTNEVEWGKSPDSSHQDMFIAGLAEGTTVTATKSATVPKLPVGSITVIKKDAGTGANLSGCVFGLRKYNGTSYVDTGTTATTEPDGAVTFSNLATDATSTGYYQVYEISAPPGYEPDSKFYCSFRVGSGWYSYVSTLAGNQSGTLADGGTVNATVSGASKPVITVSKSGDNYSATVYLYDTPKPPDTFSITLNKRDLTTGNALAGATYQLYVANSSGAWAQFKSGTVNTSGIQMSNGDWVTASASGEATATDLVTDADGTVKITELPEGPYSRVETRTVSGQTLLNAPVSITMPTIKSGSEIELEGTVYFDRTNHFYALDYIITNGAQFKLPATGGNGHLPAVLFGLLMLSALFLMLTKHHQKGDTANEKTLCFLLSLVTLLSTVLTPSLAV